MNNHASRVGVGMKLDAAQVDEAVYMRDEDGHSWASIGRRFGVAASTARKTVETWRHTVTAETLRGAAK